MSCQRSSEPGGFGDRFTLTLFTADPDIAAAADGAGVDRIGVDLEQLGKIARQPAPGSRISSYDWEDLARVAAVLRSARLFVRINPPHPGIGDEIERALSIGADVIMLPFFEHVAEVETCLRLVDGRARIIPLLETPAALLRAGRIIALDGIEEIALGLNDLHHAFRAKHHFEVMTSPLIDAVARLCAESDIALMLGGVARAGAVGLPFDPELVYAQYPRLPAGGAWVSRAFFDGSVEPGAIGREIRAVRDRLTHWAGQPPAELERARRQLVDLAIGS